MMMPTMMAMAAPVMMIAVEMLFGGAAGAGGGVVAVVGIVAVVGVVVVVAVHPRPLLSLPPRFRRCPRRHRILAIQRTATHGTSTPTAAGRRNRHGHHDHHDANNNVGVPPEFSNC